jgi:hypothetical protein
MRVGLLRQGRRITLVVIGRVFSHRPKPQSGESSMSLSRRSLRTGPTMTSM